MTSFADDMREFQSQLALGRVQAAYQGLMQYMLDLKTHFTKKHPDYSVSGSLYQGYMDMTYFAIVPETLKQRGLKIAVVFVYGSFRFEVWLSGCNRQVQARYWQLLKDSGWAKYRLVPDPKGFDSILVHPLADPPDFGDLDALTAQIEQGTLVFIQDVEEFLAKAG